MLIRLLRERTAHSIRPWTVGGVAALALATVGVVAASQAAPQPTWSAAPAAPGVAAGRCLHTSEDLSVAFEQVADTLRPSVVSITAANRVAVESRMRRVPEPFHGFPFQDFFGDQMPRWFQSPDLGQREIIRQGLGSGLIVSENGHILTNNHVIAEADELTVTLWEESSHTATVVGTDPKTDLAVLKIEAEDLVPARLADSDDLRVGQWVAAVGNPFGLASTLTAGVISAVGRSRMGLAEYEDFIQTDAAINPGNSGGPLVDLNGEVVGINTAIFSRGTGGYMGVGFAIPIEMARSVMESLIQDGHVDRGFLGVMIQNLDEGLSQSFGLEGTRGALVGDVTDGGPAGEAGIERGDIVLRFDGKEIEDVDQLRLEVAATRPGSIVAVELWRDGEMHTLEVEIGRLESDARPLVGRVESSASADLGLAVETLTPSMARRLKAPDGEGGVVVTRIDPLGVAARAGLRQNDIILSVQGREVADAASFDRIMAEADLATGVRLSVRTDSAQRFVFLSVRP